MSSIKWEITYIANDDEPASTIVVRATVVSDNGSVMNTTKVIQKADLELAGVGPIWMVWLKKREIKDELIEKGLL